MIDTTVVLLEAGLPSTAVAPIEILSTAGVLWNELRGEEADRRFRVRTASLDGGPVGVAVPLTLEPDGAIGEMEQDLVVVSAGSGDLEAELERNGALVTWLRDQRERGVLIAGICTGVPLLAEAGLLDGGSATTHWAVVDACRRRYRNVRWEPERSVTERDGVFTSGGVYSAIDMGLYLVEKYCGHRIAMETAKALVLQTPRTWQVGYATEPPEITHEDEQIADAQEWLFRHFSEEIQVESLASQVGMSPRNFARRFKAATGDTPIRYLQRLRINAARHLLEDDTKSVREVGRAVGYGDISFFRRLFRRFTGEPPQKYRERFSTRPPRTLAISERSPHA